MVLLRRILVLSLLLPACGDKASDDTDAATESPGTDASTASAAASSESGQPTTGTDTSGTGTTGSTGAASTTGSETSATAASSESGEGGTTGGLVCTLEAQACAAVEALGDYEDCGAVDPWDDLLPAWEAARDCALKAASEQRAFKLVTWLQGIDSQVGQAFVGLPAESYAVATFYFDSDPCGGGGCGPQVSQASCESLAALADCVVEPGWACLTCAGQGMVDEVCGPR
jgi:hypothetical protein